MRAQDRDVSHSRIAVDLNLEKWPLWQPARSTRRQTRMLERTIAVAPAHTVTARVTIGYVDKVGTLTTEDQRVFYALVKLWEEHGRSSERTPLSLRTLAQTLKRRWGSNVIAALTRSLVRLRTVPLILEHAYHDAVTDQTYALLDPFTLLADVQIVKRTRATIVTHDAGYFTWNRLILGNLQKHYTKPVVLDPILGFTSEIAQLLYQHLDLVMSKRRTYARRSDALFGEDLGLVGTGYRYAADRVRKLRPALQELRGVMLSSGTVVAAELLPTQDGRDHKIVIRKGATKRGAIADNPAAGSPPQLAETLPVSIPPGDEADMSAKVHALLQAFLDTFHRESKRFPTAKETRQAHALIAQVGPERAQFVVRYVKHVAPDFTPRFFGGILTYTVQALKAYDAHARRTNARQSQAHQDALRDQYEHYRHTRIAQCKADLSRTELAELTTTIRQRLVEAGEVTHHALGLATKLGVDDVLAERSDVLPYAAWVAQHSQTQP